ncbi:dihydropteroate synthase [Fervidobacterium changbaicum]|uniref:dihydropteroate synthase n=1 Tax=Fervidobacterium changbaicum TaxID=310769 RepID=A0ABX5QQ85_9BACT|nr:dihydropteroate synthase [Fervidobacterium changbaicum]QAV32472.1 dihydropteroate synthase [Fervidobacterium changbaicum]SDH58577.1 dihydropteroate synthase [Fervidobacterium changbaicum]
MQNIARAHTIRELINSKRTKVMGIINVTPDSFYSGSRVSEDELLKKVEEMVRNGVDIVDVGGESTRPGAEPVPLEEEIRRTVTAVKIIRQHFDIPISVDTYKSEVARLSLEAGADIINDISALRFDEKMVDVAAQYKCPVIIMHMKGTPKTMQQNPEYTDVIAELLDFFKERINFAKNRGVGQIIIDPGIGFGKKLEHNLAIFKHIDKFKELGYPVLIGASRKSMIGMILNLPPEERLNGTLALTAYCVMHDVDFVRVHDVKENVEVVKVMEAIKNYPL